MRAIVLLPVLAFAFLGCGPPPDQTRLVLLDEAARMSGALVQLEHWEGAPAFAVRLTPDDRPMLLTQTDARRLEVPAHTLAYVQGSDVQVRLLDLDDTARGQMVLTGSEGAAQRVASVVNAEVKALGEDRYRLEGEDLLDRSAFLEAPRGLREVRPVESTPEPMRPLLGRDTSTGSSLSWRGEGVAESVPITLVGVYASGATTLILDAEGGYTLTRECGDTVQGTVVESGDRLVLLGEDHSPRALYVLDEGGVQIGAEHLQPVLEEAP
ncbi:MAG TPA: hypothetical protein VFA20_09905 [Myxococcaceae bacterium]|nr:hypothetical protein [Myxococcaceae bacterium]